ncbi:MAG: FAD-binding protein, partial [Candidatus Eisenbacteria bacterium]|nr:FAD-binding protein [Candidatus Eisenbacteria bacterium]
MTSRAQIRSTPSRRRNRSVERASDRPVDRALDRSVERALGRAAAGSFSVRLEDRICSSFDATDLRSVPDAVAWPRTTREVSDVVRIAHQAGLPLVPRGAGTGYTGGSVPVDGGVVLSLEKMNRVRMIDVKRRLAVVEPGVVNGALREEVEALGLFYPPDPASLLVSTIGGNIAEGAGGPRTVLYGTTRDYVVGLELVMSDGSVLTTGALADRRRVAWDANPLIVASEGTLAIVTAAALRLSDRPRSQATFWADFPSLEAAAGAVAAITASGLPVSVLEILDRDTYVCAAEYVRGATPDPAPDGSLLIELEGDEESVCSSTARLMDLLSASETSGFRRAADDAEREEIWDIRRAISPSLARLSTGKINEDIAVPRSAIPAFVRRMREIADSAGLPVLAFGHAGDGNLHINVIVERADRRQMAAARDAVGSLFRAALELGGTLSG